MGRPRAAKRKESRLSGRTDGAQARNRDAKSHGELRCL